MLINNYDQAEGYISKAYQIAPYSFTILQTIIDINTYQGKYKNALKYLKEITSLYPDDKENNMILFQYYFQSEKFINAQEILDTLSKYHPNDVDVLFEKSRMQYLNKDWKNLIQTYYTLYISNTENIDIVNKIYDIGIMTGNTALVSNIFKEISIYNESPQVIELLIEVLLAEKKLEEAIDYVKMLIKIDGNTEKHIIRLGELYLLNKQPNLTILALEPVFESEIYTLEILKLLLVAYSSIENSENQIMISKKIIEKYPDIPLGYEGLAFAYLKVRDYVNSMQILLEGLNKFPNEINFSIAIADIYHQSKDYNNAEKYYLYALNIDSYMYSVHNLLAMMYEDMKKTTQSDSLFKYIINNNKNNAVHLNDYAYVISERNNVSKDDLIYALNLAEEAILIEPENAAFLDTVGWIYYKMGTYSKAQEYLEKSLSINKNNPVILEHMGDIYQKLNDLSHALVLYEQAYMIDKKNKNLYKKMKKINEQSN
tara:strand:+ start:4655 stop:6109 length:1455 start_codon:yes stop_codon:yes gene_type:complete